VTRVEWRKAPDFAQFAEALGVATTQIMAARVNPDVVFVLFTEREGDETVSVVTLVCGTDGIWFAGSKPKRMPGLWEEIQRQVEEGL